MPNRGREKMSQPPLLFSGTAEELLACYRQAVPASTTAPAPAPAAPTSSLPDELGISIGAPSRADEPPQRKAPAPASSLLDEPESSPPRKARPGAPRCQKADCTNAKCSGKRCDESGARKKQAGAKGVVKKRRFGTPSF